MKKVFLEKLPHRGKLINWSKCKGYYVSFIYENVSGVVKIIDYDGKNLYISYLDKKFLNINTGNFKKCRFGNLLGFITLDFKVEVGQILKDTKRDLVIIDREYRIKNAKYNKKWYKYKCNKCGWGEGWIEEKHLLEGNGCSCCCNPPKTVVEGINDIPTTAPWMVKYFQGGYDEAKLYTKRSGKRIYPICPECGRIKDKSISIDGLYINKTISCDCSDKIPYPEKFMFSVLEQLNINFKTQFKPKWCTYIDFNNINKIKTGRYDFLLEDVYIDNRKVIIETDGSWHGRDNKLSKQSAEESEYIDFTKDTLAIENGYKVIRIDCCKSNMDYIKNSIKNSKLSEIFDLNNIDWFKCEEFSLSNRVKNACELWNSGIESTVEIGKIMKLNRGTITRYLNKGKCLDWCNYDGKEEMRKSAENQRRNKCVSEG